MRAKVRRKSLPLIHLLLENVGMWHRHRKVKAKIRIEGVYVEPGKGD